MRLKHLAVAVAFVGAFGLLAAPADAAPKKKRIVMGNRHTVFISRDEDGRTRTKIIVQRRSYLDPGTEVLPGDEHNHDYQSLPNQSAFSVLDNTPFGNNQTALPGAFTLGSKNNPFLKF